MVAQATRQARLPFLAPDRLRRAQERRVRATVVYAHAYVPYYRETMSKLALEPADFCSAGDLAQLPVIEREQLQRDPEYFLSEQWPAEACVVLHSGGSTGAPVTVFRDPESLFMEGAHYERLRSVIARLAGRRFRYRDAHILPQDSSTDRTVSALRERTQLPRGIRVQLRTFPLRPPAELIPELNAFRPDVISAYGSYLDALFTHIREQRPSFAAPRVIMYGADSISPTVRAWVRDTLGIEVLSSYGAIEAPHIGFECERHRGYHLNADLHPVRLLLSDGSEAATGTAGEVVVSNLVNRGTVLLNYRVGDIATILPEPCPCGRSLALCSYLDRTKVAWLDLGGSEPVHAQTLRLVLHQEPEIWRYQIVQQAQSSLLLRLVPSPDCDQQATAGRIVRRYREGLGRHLAVAVEFVEDLPRGPSGKVQPIVCLPPNG
jgi:phenylacetate-CoA ligase